MVTSRYLRMPRPTHFLGLFDLQNGAELILMSALLNKVSGIYGILAIFTGAEISGLQLSMYIYSLLAGAALIFLLPRLHKRDPLAAISFAYLYVLDTVINALYTLTFGMSWFLVLSVTAPHHTTTPASPSSYTLTNSTIAPPALQGQDAVAVASSTSTGAALGAGVLAPESATSILIISVLWVVRSYFVLIVLAFARVVVRDSGTPGGEALFTGKNHGEGWEGKLGRALVGVNTVYWMGADGWERFGNKFRRSEDAGRRMNDLPPV